MIRYLLLLVLGFVFFMPLPAQAGPFQRLAGGVRNAGQKAAYRITHPFNGRFRANGRNGNHGGNGNAGGCAGVSCSAR